MHCGDGSSAPVACKWGRGGRLSGEEMEGWGDVDINTSDTSTPTHNQISSPITRAHAHQLNNQVSSFLASYSSYLDNENMYSVLLLRNNRQE
jgi:hypothetical protein